MNKTKKKKRWIWLIVIVVLIAAVLIGGSVMQRRAALLAESLSIKTVQAETKNITKTISGTGTLQTRDTEDINTVSGVKIDKVLVDAGDSVKSGETLATLDQGKLAELAADTNISLSQMDMELRSLSGKEADKTVYAPVKGRVKQIFCSEGDYASDITASKNALMVLSTDENMKVEFKPEQTVAVGDAVYVKDGNETYEAKIISASKDFTTALLTDDGPRAGKTATVLGKNKKTVLGKGTLAINSPLAINATGGKIKKIYVDDNEKVSRNKRLLKLEDNPQSSDYAKKLSLRDQKSKDYAKLLSLINHPVITADQDGVVKEVLFTDGAYATSTSADNTEVTVFKMNEKALELNVSMDELDMPYVKVGESASVSFDALPDKEFPAEVEKISSLGTTENGNTKYSVILKMSNLESVYEGMSATATITVETKQNVVAIPLEALQEDNGVNYVYANSGKPGVLGDKRNVKTGISDGVYVEITEGLSAGDSIMYKTKSTNATTQNGLFNGMRQGTQSTATAAASAGK